MGGSVEGDLLGRFMGGGQGNHAPCPSINCRSAAEFAQKRARLGRTRASCCRFRAELGRFWATSGRRAKLIDCRTMLVDPGPTLVDSAHLGRFWAPSLIDVGPNLVDPRASLVNPGPILVQIRRCPATFGRTRAYSGRRRADIGSTLAELGPSLVYSGQRLIDLGHNCGSALVKVWRQLWPMLGRICCNFVELHPTSVYCPELWAHLARNGATLGFDAVSAKFQLRREGLSEFGPRIGLVDDVRAGRTAGVVPPSPALRNHLLPSGCSPATLRFSAMRSSPARVRPTFGPISAKVVRIQAVSDQFGAEVGQTQTDVDHYLQISATWPIPSRFR